jgi:GT2 family glycosyltransferase
MWLEFGSTLGGSVERFELVMFSHVDVNPIDRARNMLLEAAVKHRADWLLMVDDDTWVESPDAADDAGSMLLRMISDADRANAAIVCAPVVRRRMQHGDRDEYMVYRRQAESIKAGQLEPLSFTNSQDCSDLTGRAPFEIDACATACIALSIGKVGAHRFRFSDLSEDLDFCRTARKAGDKILCDPRVRTGHRSRSFALYSR